MSQVVVDWTARLNICPKICSHPERGKSTVPFLIYGMNAEAAANDSEGTLRRCIGWPGYHGNRGSLYRIGNVSWGHRLIRQAFLM